MLKRAGCKVVFHLDNATFLVLVTLFLAFGLPVYRCYGSSVPAASGTAQGGASSSDDGSSDQ